MLVATNSLLGKEWIIAKATQQSDGTVAIEGWISTPLKDLEKDILEPEAFAGEGFRSYFEHGAPISSNHDTKGYPVGYLQKAILVRNGAVIQTENHPDHPRAQFTSFDGFGTGWYGRGILDEAQAVDNVVKGKIRSFSWIGHGKDWEELPDGGRRFSKKGAINPLLEVTIAAYPINQAAMLRIAKAYGYEVESKPRYAINVEAVVDAFMNSPRNQDAVRAVVDREFDRVFKRN